MALKDLRARELLLAVIGWAVTLLLIMTGTDLYAHAYREGILFLVVAAALALHSFESARFFWRSSVCRGSW
jgi:hypothetical protein